MKIGIVTWFSGSNYGTNLQAIALQQYLRNIGHEVLIVNFEVNTKDAVKLTVFQKLTDWKMLGIRIRRQPEKYMQKLAYLKYHNEILGRDKKLIATVREKCCLTQKISDEKELISIFNSFELLITGSDQIWNPEGYHRFYFADYDEVTTRRISYAPSLGVNTIPEDRKSEIRRGLSKFSAVSVREQNGVELLRPLSKKEPVVTIDPTLLLCADDWNEIFPVKKERGGKYVLSIFLTDRYSHWNAARNFVKKKKLQHVIIPYCGFSYLQKANIIADAGLQEFLDLIRGAEYVLTDSFHVTSFSLIFKKQFYAFTRFKEDAYTSQNSRVRNILSIAGVNDRFLPYGTKKVVDLKNINYNAVEKALEYEIERSKEFLSAAIGEE
ncbi:MAG: polysaccharide pyruvyl transferase family protein [Eisenbergiella sp.]|uniref:polysaccharide pyruvyl transferase family protein n=1 Tax=unclassified Eisenbergiella TaxID=2652273 RepID=UPI0015FD68CF|nr:polysaccharide pyruvyl transferase family protein [Eisenbergiella sp. OF01-20]MBS5538064.1 polysaccharide pyruvyl transferase family protein [Lachnospiraceae bacterium]